MNWGVMVNWAMAMSEPIEVDGLYDLGVKWSGGMMGQIVEARSSRQAERSVFPARLSQDGWRWRVRKWIGDVVFICY